MIIHFVAYPQSKDFLLLQAFYKLFGIPWYEADIADQTDLKVSDEEQAGGFRSAGEPWRTFFNKQNKSQSSVFFARTRRLPQDDLPFVYVSRHPASIFMDRATAQQDEEPGRDLTETLLKEVLGIGGYPDWSAHYQDWKDHKEKVSGHFVRMEDFCADPLRTLVKIAVRLHLPKPQALEEFSCPLPPDRLGDFNNVEPSVRSMLFALHGETLTELGYPPPASPSAETALEGLPAAILAKAVTLLRNESNRSKKQANAVQTMACYIASLESQYTEETGKLIERISKLTKTKTA